MEDEAFSLSKEHGSLSSYTHEPPARGIIDQYPIIVEAELSAADRAFLHAQPRAEEEDQNPERRFVVVPKQGTQASDDGYGSSRRATSGEEKDNRNDRKGALKREDNDARTRSSAEQSTPELVSRPSRPYGGPGPGARSDTLDNAPPVERRPSRRDIDSSERSTPAVSSGRDGRPRQERDHSRARRRDDKSDLQLPDRRDDARQRSPAPPRKHATLDSESQPQLSRRRSRQELPNIQTKIPRDIPPKYRRSGSSIQDEQSASTPRTAPIETYLSPNIVQSSRAPKENFGTSARSSTESFSGRDHSTSDKRSSTGSFSEMLSQTSATSASAKRPHESVHRARRNTSANQRPPQQYYEDPRRSAGILSHEESGSGSDRDRSGRSRKYRNDVGSEEERIDSGSEKDRRSRYERYQRGDLRPDDYYDHRAKSRSSRSSKSVSKAPSPFSSPAVSPSQIPRADPFEKSSGYVDSRRDMSPHTAAQDTPRASERSNPMDGPIRTRPPKDISMPAPFVHSSGLHASIPIPSPSSHASFSNPSLPLHLKTTSHSETRGPGSPRSAVNTEQPFWQPPALQPKFQSSNLDITLPPANVGSYRRYSEDIGQGTAVPLPLCPLQIPSRARINWLTLPQCPNFDVCPACFENILAPSQFRNDFVPSPRRSNDESVKCDFGSAWYRIAWLLTKKEQRRDLSLLYDLAYVTNTTVPCPESRYAVQSWHSILDPRTGRPIKDFDVCSRCVKSVEKLLPATRGIFVQTDRNGMSGMARKCDFLTETDAFIKYFDALEVMADDADANGRAPDTRDLAKICRDYASLERERLSR